MINAKAASEFIARLLNGVTMFHMHHFMVTGQGSFAKHLGLGELYASIEDLADGLAEEVIGTYDLPLGWTGEIKFTITGNPIADTQALYDYIEATRSVLGAKSHIQNSVDGLCTALAHALYKLRRLQ